MDESVVVSDLTSTKRNRSASFSQHEQKVDVSVPTGQVQVPRAVYHMKLALTRVQGDCNCKVLSACVQSVL